MREKRTKMDYVVSLLDNYSDEDFHEMYYFPELYIVTDVFYRIRTREGFDEIPFLDLKNSSGDSITTKQQNLRVLNSLAMKRIKNYLDNNKYKNEYEKSYLDYSYTTLNICNEIIFLYSNAFDLLKKANPEYKDIDNPEKLSEYHRQCNDIYTNIPWESKKKIYKFIWEVLRFLPHYMLHDLMKMCKKNDLVYKPRIKEPKICKYDKDMNLIETYTSRKECCEANNFDKSALSIHLSGKRKTLNGFIFKEE